MPIVKEVADGEPPKKEGKIQPHLGIPHPSQNGRILALGPGTPLLIIEDPTSPLGIHVLKLGQKISHKSIDLTCGCKNPKCTRKVVFTAKWSGQHPPQFGR